MSLIEAGEISLQGLITNEFGFEKINEALNLFRGGDSGRIIINSAKGGK